METNLHYNWFRYYDPSLGRFLRSDPIGLDDDPNTYAYVGSNPLIYYDPDGLIKKDIFSNLGPRTWHGRRNYPSDAYHGPKPKYKNDGHHDPKSPNFNKTKNVLPTDAQQVYRNCIPDHKNLNKKNQPRQWWGRNKDGDYYRFSNDNFGNAHYSGTFRANDKRIPAHIRNRLSGGGGGGSSVNLNQLNKINRGDYTLQ